MASYVMTLWDDCKYYSNLKSAIQLEYTDENPLTKISATTIISIDRWNFLQTPK